MITLGIIVPLILLWVLVVIGTAVTIRVVRFLCK